MQLLHVVYFLFYYCNFAFCASIEESMEVQTKEEGLATQMLKDDNLLKRTVRKRRVSNRLNDCSEGSVVFTKKQKGYVPLPRGKIMLRKKGGLSWKKRMHNTRV